MTQTRNALQMYFNDKGEFPYTTGDGAGTVGAQYWKTGVGYGLVEQGYIKEVHPDIRYFTVQENGFNTCGSTVNTCIKAWLYVKLENRNTVLNSDIDNDYNSVIIYVPDGLSNLDNCENVAGITDATDLCYDLEV